MFSQLFTVVSVLAFSDALKPYKHIMPRCNSMKACVVQLIEISDIASGEFKSLTDPNLFKNFCQAKDHCSSLYFKDIEDCSDYGDNMVAVKYKIQIREFLCSEKGRKEVALLNEPLCPTNKTQWNTHYTSCIAQKESEKKFSKNMCLIIDDQSCIIQAFTKYCGSAYSTMQRQISTIIQKHYPECV